ncbi:MAG: Oxidoreductase [Massilia sp.]|nr:Oxidoreductase [Massilia sp.]
MALTPVTLNLIGAGHLGRALGRLFAAGGVFIIQDVLTRSRESAQDAVGFIGAGRAVASFAELRPADVVMLAVSDDQIEAACAALDVAAGTVLFHCSGAKSSAALAALVVRGAFTASVHPVRSFADPATVAADFTGTLCGIEGDPQALAVLRPAFEAIGARCVAIDAAAKTLYHAAAVFASNYLVTVMDAALRAYQAAGIDEATARELAGPLATETLNNVLRLGARASLSGPVARGDMATVARQQEALDGWDTGTGELYRALAAATVTLARR